MIHLPPNPSRFDYLHAIRALASRTGQTEILDLADKAMDMDETDEAQRLLARLCRAVSRRMMLDEPTPEDRMELREAFDAASALLSHTNEQLK